MSEPAPPIVKPEIALIEDLLEEIKEGRLRIPRFQRPFVWKPEDMRELFNSIQQGYPIGSLLLWNTSDDVQSFDQVGPLTIPDAGTRPVTYILDGHQRLSTLYGVLRLPGERPRGPDQDHWQWWLGYDLKNDEFVHESPGRPFQPYFFPLRALLRTTDFLSAARSVQEKLPEEAEALIDRAERLAQKIKSYKLAVIRIQGGSLAQAVEIFSRLNSKGQPITADQMISALSYREGAGSFQLAGRIDEILQQLSPFHFEGLHRGFIFRAIVAATGEDIFRADSTAAAKKLKPKLQTAAEEASEALLGAARFASDTLGIPTYRLLPYSHQFVALSEFFRLCPEPDDEKISILQHWFWATSFAGWYARANSTQINRMLERLRQLARGELVTLKALFSDDDSCLQAPVRPYPTTFDFRSARVRTLLLVLLHRLVPLLPDGRALDTKALLSEHGAQAFRYVVRKIKGEIASDPANRILLPPEVGHPVKTRLLEIAPELRDRVLASHGIPEEAFAALTRGDDTEFIRTRATHLAALEREFISSQGLTLPASERGNADIDTDDG